MKIQILADKRCVRALLSSQLPKENDALIRSSAERRAVCTLTRPSTTAFTTSSAAATLSVSGAIPVALFFSFFFSILLSFIFFVLLWRVIRIWECLQGGSAGASRRAEHHADRDRPPGAVPAYAARRRQRAHRPGTIGSLLSFRFRCYFFSTGGGIADWSLK